MQEPAGEIDHEAVRRYRRRYFTSYAVCVGGLTVLAVAASIAAELSARHHHRPVRTGEVAAGLAILVVSALGGSVALWLLSRRPAYQRLFQYAPGRRRRVLRALQKGARISPEDRSVADALMYANRHAHWIPAVFGFGLLGLIVLVALQHGHRRWFWLAMAVLYVVLIPLTARQQRRMRDNYDRLVRSDPPPESSD